MRMLYARSAGIVAIAGLLAVVAAISARAATPLGPAFQVNSDDSGGQVYPKVESDGASGSFVVVWYDNYASSIEMRRVDPAGVPAGSDFQVNQLSEATLGDYYVDTAASVAVDPTGGFVVAWFASAPEYSSTYYYVHHTFLRLFDSSGAPRGDEFTTTTPEFYDYYSDDAVNPQVSMDSAGEFVVAWEGTGYWTDPEYPAYSYASADVFGQVHGSSGAPSGGEFQANLFEYEHQANYGDLDVARAPSGDSFVVVWGGAGRGIGSGYYSYPSYGVHGRRFLFDSGVSSQFRVATDAEENMGGQPQIAMDPAANFIVVWSDLEEDGTIRARRFSRAGVRLGDPFIVSEDDGEYPAVDGDDRGNFVVVWREGGLGVRGRVLDALGNRRGSEFEVDDCGFCSNRGGPDVASLGDEQFTVIWHDDDASGDGVFARRFAMDPLSEVLLGGKKLEIRNGPVDIPELRRATWIGRGLNLASPTRGSADDPRCNGDPNGTVKASVRFFSNASGADSGELALPCEKWKATGPSSSDPLAIQGFKYRDAALAGAGCSTVVLKRTKLVKASCREVPYDLVSGTDEGTVHAVLTLGQVRYCTSFDDFNGRDGSDGLRFQGKDAPAPVDCPMP